MPKTIIEPEEPPGDGFRSLRLSAGFIDLVDRLVNANIFASRAQATVALGAAGIAIIITNIPGNSPEELYKTGELLVHLGEQLRKIGNATIARSGWKPS